MHRPLLILVLLLSAWFLQNCDKAEPDPRENAVDGQCAMWLADVAFRRGSYRDPRAESR